jgi:hypothetical protein
MANSTRDVARRKLQSAIDNLDSPMGHLSWFIEMYLEDHPELAQTAIDSVAVLKELKLFIIRLRELV